MYWLSTTITAETCASRNRNVQQSSRNMGDYCCTDARRMEYLGLAEKKRQDMAPLELQLRAKEQEVYYLRQQLAALTGGR